MKVEILHTDITKLEVDAIVNAANNSLLGGGGVDGAIHRAAGPALLAECKKLKGCETGSAKITQGYNLPASHVIHTVGPVWNGGSKNEEALLASCYKQCMIMADKNNIKSIAFPAISCGVYRFPVQKACDIAICETLKFTGKTGIERLIFACFGPEVEQALHRSLMTWSGNG